MLRRPTNELLIRPRWSKRLRVTVTITVIICTIAALYGAWRWGYFMAVDQQEERQQSLELTSGELRKANRRIERLSLDLAKAERQKQIQDAAYEEVNKTYQKVEQKNEFLQRRVNFYRSIISPEDGVAGVKVHDVRTRVLAEGGVDFELVLIQAMAHQKEVKVGVTIELYESRRQKTPIAVWPASGVELVEFRYSQVLEGVLSLPEADSGMVMKVIARINNKDSSQLVEWHKL